VTSPVVPANAAQPPPPAGGPVVPANVPAAPPPPPRTPRPGSPARQAVQWPALGGNGSPVFVQPAAPVSEQDDPNRRAVQFPRSEK